MSKSAMKVHVIKRKGAPGLHVALTATEAVDTPTREMDLLELTRSLGVRDMVGVLAANDNLELRYQLADRLGLLPTEEIGQDGNDYGTSGILHYKEQKPIYHPLSVRGNRTRHGIYEEMWRGEIQVQRPWVSLLDALIGGEWWVEPVEGRKAEAEFCEAALFGITGGWDAFLTNALYALIAGFALFETVYDARTLAIDKLAFRYPKQVVEWVVSHDNSKLLATKLAGPNGRKEVLVPAHHLLIISHNAFGMDFEGNSPLRPVAKYIEVKAMLDRLEALAGEKYGGLIFVITSDGAKDSGDSDYLTRVVSQLVAEDMAVFEMPDGRKFELISPQGQMPDFEPIKRYCDEQIAMALHGEGALLGQDGVGSYALADVTDNKALRAAPAQARRICSAINGSRGIAYQGVIRKMVDARFGVPADGRYPQLKFALNRTVRDHQWFQSVATAKQAGLITWNGDDERTVREQLGLSTEVTT